MGVTLPLFLCLLALVALSLLLPSAHGCGCSAATRSFMDDAGVLHTSEDEQVITQTDDDASEHAGMVLITAGSFRYPYF